MKITRFSPRITGDRSDLSEPRGSGPRAAWLLVGQEFLELAHPFVQILRRHDVGQREADGRQFPGQELRVGLGPGRHFPVALDIGPVAVVLPVLGQQDQRSGVRGLGGEGQVEQDERIRIPVPDETDGVERDPDDDEDGLPGQEAAGTEEPGDPLRHPPERV